MAFVIRAADQGKAPPPHDAVMEAQTVRPVPVTRPEQPSRAVLPRRQDAQSPGEAVRGRAATGADQDLHPGIKDSPPYLHDGRCLTLEDTVSSST
jgi:hypothetical protein